MLGFGGTSQFLPFGLPTSYLSVLGVWPLAPARDGEGRNLKNFYDLASDITLNYSGYTLGLPQWLSGKEPTYQCRRHRFDPWIRKIPWRRKWHLVQYSCLENPMDREAWWATRVGQTERLSIHAHTST